MMASRSQRQRQIPERWLYWTYQDSNLLPDQLLDINGRPIVLVDRGRRNWGDGPDFFDALIKIDGVLTRGDVEFHVNPQDWFRHGHQDDRRYTQVILHCIWDCQSTIDPALASRFPHVSIADNLQKPATSWIASMAQIENGFVADSPSINIPSAQELAGYSERRFLRRCDRFLEYLPTMSASDLCYAAFAEALGYRKNQAVMFNLMLSVPASEMANRFDNFSSTSLLRFAALLIYSGLNPPPRRTGSPLNDAILARLDRGDIPLFRSTNWSFGKVRPSNRPLPRLAALAQLLPSRRGPSIFPALQASLMERSPLKKVLFDCENLLRRPLTAALKNALCELQPDSNAAQFTLGRQRVRQFVVSSLLPLMWAIAARRQQTGFQIYLEDLYEQFPGSESPDMIKSYVPLKTADSLRALIGKSAFYQQGVLEFYALRQGELNNRPAY